MKYIVNPQAILSNGSNDNFEFTVTSKDFVTKTIAKNMGPDATIDEVILIQCENPFPSNTPVYGEGYSMLSQYSGTIEETHSITAYDDATHYRLPQKEGFNTLYNMALFNINESEFVLIGFSSCRKFGGEIRFNPNTLEISLITEGLILKSNESWVLEDLFIKTSNNREKLLSDFAEKIGENHPALKCSQFPTGWCSWYCFGPRVTESDILNNMNKIKELNLNLKYIQIDDGYQEYMGDWLFPAKSFPNGIKPLFDKIIESGFEPAIWVAPFIAQKESTIFKSHPDWFIHDDEGNPLPSDNFTFGGWRYGPWYMLDPTNPQAYEHLKSVFRVMRNEWNCKYFKLDANMWGAMHKGIHFDKKASKIESYRLGMQAVLEGAGQDSFILGCNAPMWPSIGTVHGNRITGDICRNFEQFKLIAKEGLYRNWQNSKLWINDPDCVTIENQYDNIVGPTGVEVIQLDNITDDEFLFHATYIYASGGMVLSGDDLSSPTIQRINILKYLLNSKHTAAKFDDTFFNVGRIELDDKLMLCLFNWQDTDISLNIDLDGEYNIHDVWHNISLGEYNKLIDLTVRAHGGLLLECRKTQ